ncbi:glutamate mutase L [Geodermatophilus sp. YIM 151500]|uniref:glutamate mutase L n=1 Tax=Geodermatophilus sp. YIM 151500 TaxID=2984531 RepID=UPI0021E4047B|nr:glutamate mutase L [Geodermatophilus sp. YIM 151500]MCV2490546.1 glutamate mutase L [Geodermatophilus sp. YIM 151500]
MTPIACVDIGSTFTKAALVRLPGGALEATAQAPTTLDDVVRGVLEATRDFPEAPVVACSSAGGGLRLAVVGYEELISAEAGHRAALSAGARVVHVAAGRLDAAGLAAVDGARPDVVLLVGGTDGGEASVLRHNAAALASPAPLQGPGPRGRGLGSSEVLRRSVPVVLAGNAAVREEVAGVLRAGGRPVREAANVLPDIGRLAPESARAAIREVYLEHVIGGDRLSTDSRLRRWVRAVTPDAVLEGVAVLARVRADAEPPGVVVVDVGGATTDVYCVPDPDAEQTALGREAVGVPARRRTVEGDLGVSWSADALRAAAAAEGLPAPGDRPLALGEAAAAVALRRHLRAEAAYGPGGASARGVGLVVLSGGVFRHADDPTGVVARLAADGGGAGSVLAGAAVVVDRRYVLAAAGLVAADHPRAAEGLARALLLDADPVIPPAATPR